MRRAEPPLPCVLEAEGQTAKQGVVLVGLVFVSEWILVTPLHEEESYPLVNLMPYLASHPPPDAQLKVITSAASRINSGNKHYNHRSHPSTNSLGTKRKM